MRELQMRAFTPGDEERLQTIRAAAFAPVFQSFRALLGSSISAVALANVEQEQAEELSTICAPESDRQLYVGVVDEMIVGFVTVSLDHKTRVGEIGLNAVHPDYVGCGIGTQLYEFALEQMRQAGMAIATVGTGGDSSHAPARRAYEKAGFGPSIPSIWMYKPL